MPSFFFDFRADLFEESIVVFCDPFVEYRLVVDENQIRVLLEIFDRVTEGVGTSKQPSCQFHCRTGSRWAVHTRCRIGLSFIDTSRAGHRSARLRISHRTIRADTMNVGLKIR